MKKCLSLLLICLLLVGCSGNPLPSGMDEDTVIKAGVTVVKLVGDGDYEAVLELFREDVRESLTAEQLRDLVDRNTEGCGYYIQVKDSMATGQKSDGEEYGVAVLYTEYSDGNIVYRIAFDTDMNLIGLSVKEQ